MNKTLRIDSPRDQATRGHGLRDAFGDEHAAPTLKDRAPTSAGVSNDARSNGDETPSTPDFATDGERGPASERPMYDRFDAILPW